tara:strand:+ start:272 stop:394 length:123 start_codon:yes stop_codon:yes gene_type:complete
MPGKKMTMKQKKIASMGGNRNKIDGADFAKLRKMKKKKKK